MKKILENLKTRISFKFHPVTILPLLYCVFALPFMKYLPVRYAWENSLLENIQLIIIAITFLICLKSKKDKAFYKSMALVCIIIFLREINCGRTIFFPVPGVENSFYGWKEIPYGYLAEPIYGTFIFASGLYFIFSKAYKTLFDYILSAKLYIYNWFFLFIGIILGTIGEKMDLPVMEEMFESCFYCALLALIYLQIKDRQAQEK